MRRDVLEIISDTHRICLESWQVKSHVMKLIEEVTDIKRQIKNNLRKSKQLILKAQNQRKNQLNGDMNR